MIRQAKCDVIVIGGGSAAFESAVSAKEAGADRVIMLEKAPESEYGGNARYSHTGFRFCHSGKDEIRAFLPDLDPALFEAMEIPPYTHEQFLADLMRVTQGLIDPDLANALVVRSNESVHWMLKMGIRWTHEKYLTQNGRHFFEPGRVIQPVGGGLGQLQQWRAIAQKLGIDIRFESSVSMIHGNARHIDGVRVSTPEEDYDLFAPAIITCAGGFQANPEMRARYLGENADLMKVRGSKHNTGEVLQMFLALGAKAAGHWQGAHASPIDAAAPNFETPVHADGRGNTMNRYDYCHGITVNAMGQRFYDEGEAFHSYTYAKTGHAVRKQPGGIAFQLYDKKGIAKFRHGPDYEATYEEADNISELARKIGVNAELLTHTIETFNASIMEDVPYQPSKLDGRGTRGIQPPKSNWARKLDEAPFRAYPVRGGITFSFGGLGVNDKSQVLNSANRPIRGLYASGDIMGLFFHNYPSCTGQTRNIVFSLQAGRQAASPSN